MSSSPRRLRRHLPAFLSIVLHAALVLLAVKLGDSRPPQPAAPEPIELEVWEASPPAVAAPKVTPVPTSRPRPIAKVPKRQPTKVAEPVQPKAAPPELASPEPASPTVEAPPAPAPLRPALPSAPLAFSTPERTPGTGALVLTPSARVAERHGVGSFEGAAAGVTVRPGEPAPDAGYQLAQEERTVEGRIEGMLQDTLARDRVDKGLVDDYFVELKRAFEKSASTPPKLEDVTNPVGAAVSSYVGGMKRYGATGNPYSEGTDARHKEPGSLDALRTDNPAAQGGQQALNRYQDFVDGKFAKGMVAVVEVKQARDGKLLDAQLLTSSGLPAFDSYALESVPGAIATLPAPSGGGGIHDWGIHSVWAFEGKIVYAQPMQGAGDAAYLIFGGSFEETTGTVYVNKLDKPMFVCKVRLLKVY